jgi:diguanylate cyclase (GGDEF)-like protein/PAS domain S-box-containing protein
VQHFSLKVPNGHPRKSSDPLVLGCDLAPLSAAVDAHLSEAQRLRGTLDAIPQMVWGMSADGSEHYYNEQWTEFTGVRLNDTTDTRLSLVHPDDRGMAAAAWQKALLSGETYDCEYRLCHRSGEYRWVHSRAHAKSIGGASLFWYGVVSDIHDRKCAELALAESEGLHRSILKASEDCIIIIGVDGRLEMMNEPGARAIEVERPEQLLGRDWASLWPKAARRTVKAAIDQACAGRAARFTGLCPTARGTPKWWDVVVTPITGTMGEVIRLLSISRDITAFRAATDRLRWTSEHDGLTDLPNRRSFQAHLQSATLRAMESTGSVGLLLLDLDHFKHVNDTLGHAAGDFLLRTFGQRLREAVRGTDFVARLGGDEFAVVLEGIKSPKDLLRVGETISTRTQAPITFEGRMISAGASIGGATFPEDAATAHDLFKSADIALYALKNTGRGGTRLFHNHMREEAQKAASQLSLARVAVSEQSVIPHYQQKVNLKTGRICGFEALLRWYYPGRGLQMPDTVAEAFKNYELASKIGELMQTKVLADIRNWQRAGVDFGTISINASPAEFLRDDYAEKLLARLGKSQVPGTLLEIEVTEHVFMDSSAQYVRRALHLLREAGITISLDDFGTGYSSLSHLRDFPVGVVKIDRSFTAKVTEEPEIASIVTAVIDLARSLSLDVVAEGVETGEQRQFLCERNCLLGQGFLFGRAVIADEVPVLLGRGAP